MTLDPPEHEPNVVLLAAGARRASTDVLDDAAVIDGGRQGLVPDIDHRGDAYRSRSGPIYVPVCERQEQVFQRPRSSLFACRWAALNWERI